MKNAKTFFFVTQYRKCEQETEISIANWNAQTFF